MECKGTEKRQELERPPVSEHGVSFGGTISRLILGAVCVHFKVPGKVAQTEHHEHAGYLMIVK